MKIIEIKIKNKNGYFYYVRTDDKSVVLDSAINKAARLSESLAKKKISEIKKLPVYSAITSITVKEFSGVKNPVKKKVVKKTTKKPVKKPVKKPTKKTVKKAVKPSDIKKKLVKAGKTLKTFTGRSAKKITVFRTNRSQKQVGTKIGDLVGVIYRADRDGKKECYIHKFKPRSRPILYANSANTEIGIVGGKYEFLPTHGIVDR